MTWPTIHRGAAKRLVEIISRGGRPAWSVLAFATLALRLPILVLPPFLKDEASYSALAVRVLEGVLPYVGAVDHKPPGTIWLYAAVYWLVGHYQIIFVHVLLMAVVMATAVLVGETARKLLRHPDARIAGLLYVLASATGIPGDVQAANAELFLNLPLAAAASVLASSFDERVQHRMGLRLIVVGLLTGLGGLFKYQAVLIGLAWAAAVAVSRTHRHKKTSLALLLSGFSIVAIGFLAYLWSEGAWEAFQFWGWQYGIEYSRLLGWPEIARNGLLYTVVVGGTWSALLLSAVWSPVRPRLALFWIATAMAAISIGGRFSPHYYLIALPPLCILATPGTLTFMSGAPRVLRVAAAVLGVSSMIGFSIASWSWFHIKPQNFQARYEAVGAYIRANAAPADRIFVWGNSPEIYLYAERVMGTRFAFCNYHTGMIWGTWANDQEGAVGTEVLSVPRAWQELLADLTESAPMLLVDGGAGGLDRFDPRPMTAYPILKEVLDRSYRLEATVSGVPIYRRIS